jgi:hypothetical protein
MDAKELALREQIEDVLRDPPRVHAMHGAEHGVWPTDPDCYAYMGSVATPGAKTLETGCGVSTALFALWGADHTCVVYHQQEADVLLAWAAERDIDTSSLRFEVGPSELVLPRLVDDGELDLVFVDGSHGFPAAIIDWFYAAGRLRDGGIAVFDDAQLASVKLGLFDFLDADPRWEGTRVEYKWVAVRRRSAGPLSEDWPDQPFVNRLSP